ncbi:MAG: alpha-ketoacid dehydrogenase subunit beta [Actinobacteria bacterium]|jgi:pyruvate dehydrogenase E1 component beta subunit|nr:alpha-ketoacid dehydrogenase subunit beta [Actinomycetota bacterium]
MTQLTMAKAITAGLRKAMEDDPKVVLFGEDIGRLGGVFRVTDGLQKDFGEHRVMDSPLAESGIVGTAVGLAMRGYRPVVEIQFDGFVYPAFDQIVSQVAKMHRRTEGLLMMPIVVRIPYGGGIGAVEHHSESPEAYFTHTAGLRVLSPSDPQAAYLTIQQAIACDDPVVYFEPKRRYWDKGDVDLSIDATDLAQVPGPWRARLVRRGTDVTVACYGPMVRTCLEAAEASADVSLEVIDLQSLSPLDMDTVVSSVERTGRLVVVHEATANGGLGAEVATRVTERCFYSLEAPVLRVAGFDVPYPPSRLEEHFLPNLDRVLDAVDRAMAF